MKNLKLFFRIYFSPASAMSDTIDRGSWVVSAIAVLIVAGAFYASVNLPLHTAYRIPVIQEFFESHANPDDEAASQAVYNQSLKKYEVAMNERAEVPVLGDRFFYLFDVEPSKFYEPLFLLSIFYIPAAILLMSVFGSVGSFGLVLRRDYGALAVCTLFAWAAAHLPFAIAGFVLNAINAPANAYLALWMGSSMLFGVFMVFAIRTVFGANFGVAMLVVCFAWPAMSLGLHVFTYVSPLMFSPFLLFYAFMYLGGSIGGEVRGFGNAFRQKQNFKRFLHNATVNPKDADAHVQLGLIYLQRRQDTKAVEHLNKALAIDRTEIDANYEMGKLARKNGELQTALDHFAVVLEQDDKHALSEIWREIGATYLAAGMLNEAKDALEKFVERRSGDPEGLYYFGKVLKADGDHDRASELFAACVDYAKMSPDFRRASIKHWSKLAQKEL